MATGTIKVFHTDRNFGFVTTDDGLDVYVHADQVEGGALKAGDVIDFEIAEDEDSSGRAATGVTVVKEAKGDNPTGRTMAAPPTWDVLEERDRQRRALRRRRR